jgi:Alginate lyase
MRLMRRRTAICGAVAVAAVLFVAGGFILAGPQSTRSPVPGVSSPPAAGPTDRDLPSPGVTGSPAPSTGHTGSPPPAGGTRAPAVFVHPGVLLTRDQLDFVRGKVQAGAQPWKSAYDALRANLYASLTRSPAPRATVECGPYSNPNVGCTDEVRDALAAYADALVWYISRDARYATEAIRIMDAWSATLTGHTGSNAPLQTGWSGASWSRAAELIRYTYPGGWPNLARFAKLLRTVYLPVLIGGSGANGNWELAMTDAAMGIAVFLDDKASFNRTLALWRGRVPAYIYLRSDGPTPLSPPGRTRSGASLISFWYGQTSFVDGLAQETCRDFTHTAAGFNAAFQAAETARAQGIDLWGEQRVRFAAALEFHAYYELGNPVPAWLCDGNLTLGTRNYWEVGYNALHTRLRISLPNTEKVLESRRPVGTDNCFSGWETLTFYANPS